MTSMSDWSTPRLATYHGILDVDDWHLKAYSFAASSAPSDIPDPLDVVAGRTRELNELYLSDEFHYLRTGFALCHFGRRGITTEIFHFGLWDDMPEIFHVGWYTYGYVEQSMEVLGHEEPILCFHDIPVALAEILLFRSLVADLPTSRPDGSVVAQEYLAAGAAAHS